MLQLPGAPGLVVPRHPANPLQVAARTLNTGRGCQVQCTQRTDVQCAFPCRDGTCSAWHWSVPGCLAVAAARQNSRYRWLIATRGLPARSARSLPVGSTSFSGAIRCIRLPSASAGTGRHWLRETIFHRPMSFVPGRSCALTRSSPRPPGQLPSQRASHRADLSPRWRCNRHPSRRRFSP